MAQNELLIDQLNTLLRLTQTEQMIAQTRLAQAATSQIERDLEHNSDKCRERSNLLNEAIRSLGGMPDLVGLAAGRLGATLKATAEQGQDLDEAILGDLALEHQLLDRTRFARMLAVQLGENKVVRTLDRLEVAHSATVEWLMQRLGEIAIGAQPGLRPTPVQSVVGFGRRVGQYPARQAAGAVNRSVDTVQQWRDRSAEAVSTNVDRTRRLVEAAGEIWTAGRDASLRRTEQLATERGDRDTAANIHRTRGDLGALDASELPIRGYDTLPVATANRRIDRLTDADDVRAVLAYEEANKARKSVVTNARRSLETLASELAAAS